MRALRIAALALGAFVLAAVAGVGQPDGAHGVDAESKPGITVSGTASVSIAPNQAEFSFGTRTEATGAKTALEANSEEVAKVIAALKAAGIDGKDLQTQSLSLTGRYSDDGETLLGYMASNTVRARLTDLSRTGEVIDAAVAAGANNVSGPAFMRSDREEIYRNALKAAVAEARSKARVLAAEAGLTLGKVVAIEEEGGAIPYPVQDTAALRAAAPIEPGRDELTATLSVTFAVA